MSEDTALDTAHAAMTAAPQDDAARLRFYERMADSELFLLLEEEAKGDALNPSTFQVTGGTFVLVFDREERLARFVGAPAPYAALSGRAIAGMLADRDIGLGVNLEVAPSAILIPAEAVGWLARTLDHAPDAVEARISEVSPPTGLPDILLTALDAKLATAAGMAHSAYLVAVRHDTGAQGHLLAFVDAVEGGQAALARAAGEALTFSGIEAGAIDVGFFAATDAMAARLARVGLRFDLPQVAPAARDIPAAPGSNPDKPPILR